MCVARRFEAPNVVSCYDLRDFWLHWAENRVRVGAGTRVGENMLTSYQYPQNYYVNYAAVSSCCYSRGEWQFLTLGEEGSKVSLDLAFEMSRSIVSAAFRRGFALIADRMVKDFCRRADCLLVNNTAMERLLYDGRQASRSASTTSP